MLNHWSSQRPLRQHPGCSRGTGPSRAMPGAERARTRRLARAALLRPRANVRDGEPVIYAPNYAHHARFPNVWKCHIALSIALNFCPPINAQFPSKDKAVHYFWLTNSARGALILPRALRGRILHRDCLRAVAEQAHF